MGFGFGGSSPRMRGAQTLSRTFASFAGIIPADAGSTMGRRGSHSLTKDHPRGCGEHQGGASSLANLAGSSPRMRGARQT